MANSGLRFCSYNCRSVKSYVPDVLRLCSSHDIVCIHEHWLLPTELCFLSNLHCDFYSTATSAVDITNNVLTGRPYGDTANLYRKSLCAGFNASVFSTYDTCFTGLRLSTDVGPLLLLNVYMPTDYNDEERELGEICLCMC